MTGDRSELSGGQAAPIKGELLDYAHLPQPALASILAGELPIARRAYVHFLLGNMSSDNFVGVTSDLHIDREDFRTAEATLWAACEFGIDTRLADESIGDTYETPTGVGIGHNRYGQTPSSAGGSNARMGDPETMQAQQYADVPLSNDTT